jgi:hypothetical protein
MYIFIIVKEQYFFVYQKNNFPSVQLVTNRDKSGRICYYYTGRLRIETLTGSRCKPGQTLHVSSAYDKDVAISKQTVTNTHGIDILTRNERILPPIVILILPMYMWIAYRRKYTVSLSVYKILSLMSVFCVL